MSILKILLGPAIGWLVAFLTAQTLQKPDVFPIVLSAFWMLTWWITQAVPMPVTALLPLILFPSLEILDLKTTAAAYGHDVVFLFLGGFLLALALEKHGLHLATAQWILRRTGKQPKRLLLGFSLAAAFLSMWISNTATTMMMLPMAVSVFPHVRGTWAPKFRKRLLLALAYASSIGGIATLIGTPPNAILRGFSAEMASIQLDFFPWMTFALPLSALLLTLMIFLFSARWDSKNLDIELPKTNFFGTESALTANQKRILIIFGLTILGWMLGPRLGNWLGISISDSSVAIFGAILLFIVSEKEPGKQPTTLLEWKDTSKLAWGVILLFGGGFALAKGLETSGLLQILSDTILKTGIRNPWILMGIFTLTALFFTELMSNVALVTLMIPVVISAAKSLELPPLFFAIPITLASSMAFMFPMATPPNAIVFSGSELTVKDMATSGFWLNLITSAIIILVCGLIFEFFPGLFS
jgi:sodium-dependent dicarboxylate transporter 2/3/5